MKHDLRHVPNSEFLVDCVGNTPLIELDQPADFRGDVTVYAKLENMNPGGSFRDRPVARMLMQARMDEHFEGGRGLLDACGGNAGVSYAMLGAALGIPMTLVLPEDTPREILSRIAAHGADIVLSPGLDAARDKARRLAEERPERFWFCDQYHNPANWQAHYYSTGAEILSQLATVADTLPDAFVVGVDTGGILTGVGRRLRVARPDIHLAVAVPQGFPGVEGLRPLGEDGSNTPARPAMLDASMVHERLPVTRAEAEETCHALARQGLFVGLSAGAHARAAWQLAERGQFQAIVTILTDTGLPVLPRKSVVRNRPAVAAH